MPEQRLQRLAPKAIAKRLFGIDPDRDERASQLCAETLLTIAASGYRAGADELQSPKVRRFAVRSLVLGANFLDGFPQQLDGGEMTAAEYGSQLAAGEDFKGADNLPLAKAALRSLIDPSTDQGQPGQRLLLPFHETLLWYDARTSGQSSYTVRKVRMRGSGITFARMLLDPPPSAQAAELGERAVKGIQEALTLESPLSEIAAALEEVLPEEAKRPPVVEEDERQSWALGAHESMAELARALCRHAAGVSGRGGASGPAKLWQLRTVLALDLAINALRRAWEVTESPESGRCLLLAVAGSERRNDRGRLRSERSYDEARTAIRWATIATLAKVMDELARERHVDWSAELEARTANLLQQSVVDPLRRKGRRADFRALAQLAFENANYDRSGEGFRVLLESIGMSAGGTRYRYLSATPDLLSALVGALSADMPMTSQDFFSRVGDEWGLVISPEAAMGTVLRNELDGADLATNARRFEKLMIEAGLASGVSDRTVLVGERAGRRPL
jgi:hypothetical protein